MEAAMTVNGPFKPSEISEKTGLTYGNVAVQLDRLAQKGVVVKDKLDKTSFCSYVGITATASTVHDIEASPVFSEKLEAPTIGILTSSLSRDTYLYPSTA